MRLLYAVAGIVAVATTTASAQTGNVGHDRISSLSPAQQAPAFGRGRSLRWDSLGYPPNGADRPRYGPAVLQDHLMRSSVRPSSSVTRCSAVRDHSLKSGRQEGSQMGHEEAGARQIKKPRGRTAAYFEAILMIHFLGLLEASSRTE